MQQTRIQLRAIMLMTPVLMLSGCSEPADQAIESTTTTATSTAPRWEGETVVIDDNEGTKTVPFKPDHVVTFDEGTAELLGALGVDASVAASADDAAALDPDLVVVGGARPDGLADGGAPVIDISPRPEPPRDWEVVRQVQILGQIVGKEEEAKKLDDDFSAALQRARDEMKEGWTVSAVRAHDGQIGSLPVGGGELWGPVIEMLGLKPVELQDNPDVLLVAELAPDLREAGYVPSLKLIAEDESMKNIPAVKGMNIYVSPFDAPATGSLIAYTRILNELAEHWSR